MLKPERHAPREAEDLLGELHPLMAQLGSADGLLTLTTAATALRLPQVDTRRALRAFLEAYREQLLLPLELPAISRARLHASRGQVRELIALDQEIARHPLMQDLAAPSRRVGRAQLEKFRALRDERGVQRYRLAVKNGEAHGWHTVVYGITLAIYSLPVRQGLLSYARHTLRGFLGAAARPLRLSRSDGEVLMGQLADGLSQALEQMPMASELLEGAEAEAKPALTPPVPNP